MIFVDLADGRSFAVRPRHGTKIKYYLFGHGKPGEPVKGGAAQGPGLSGLLWAAVEKDARTRSDS